MKSKNSTTNHFAGFFFGVTSCIVCPALGLASDSPSASKVSAYRECLYPLKEKIINSPHLLNNETTRLSENSFFSEEDEDPKLSPKERKEQKDRMSVYRQFRDAVVIPGKKNSQNGYYILTEKSALFIAQTTMGSEKVKKIKTDADAADLGEWGAIIVRQYGKPDIAISWKETYRYPKGKKPATFTGLSKESTNFSFSLPDESLLRTAKPPYQFKVETIEESDSNETLSAAQDYLSSVTEKIKCPGFQKAEWDHLVASEKFSREIKIEGILKRFNGKRTKEAEEEIRELKNDFFAQERHDLLESPSPSSYLSACKKILDAAQIKLQESFLSLLEQKKGCLATEHKKFVDQVSGTAGFTPTGGVIQKSDSTSTNLNKN